MHVRLVIGVFVWKVPCYIIVKLTVNSRFVKYDFLCVFRAVCLHAAEKGRQRSRTNTGDTEETEEEDVSIGEDEEEDVCMVST